jgi:hypothetical protein
LESKRCSLSRTTLKHPDFEKRMKEIRDPKKLEQLTRSVEELNILADPLGRNDFYKKRINGTLCASKPIEILE